VAALGDRRSEEILAVALALAFLVVQIAAFHGVRLDDAYITYRYSQNLATGHGFAFNPGDHILGTTSPGQALLGAIVYTIVGRGSFPGVMSAIGCAGWTAQAVCAYLLLREAFVRACAAFVAVAIAAGATRAHAWVPLETHLVCALVLAAFALAAHGRWVTCGIVAGLAVVFRGDALVACVPLLAIAVLELRAGALRPVVACVAVLLPWALFSTAYFGSPLPHTVMAKVGRVPFGVYAGHVFHDLPLNILPWSRLTDTGTEGTKLTALFGLALAGAGAVVLARRSRILAGIVAYGVLLAAAYLVMRPDPRFGWHTYPVVLVLVLCALAALVALAERLRPVLARPLACAVVVALATDPWLFAFSHQDLLWFGMRDRLDQRLAGYLISVAAPTDVVDSEEVGTLAYWSGLPMLDHPGLVSTGAWPELWAAVDGRPSPVKWAVLNGTEYAAFGARFEGWPGRRITELPIGSVNTGAASLTRILFDLRPRAR
jgi:arabinofuranosyltransferase